MLVLRYTDRPGVIGTLGGLLGAAGINIASMQVARAAEGRRGRRPDVDVAVPHHVVDEIVREVGAPVRPRRRPRD
jgi:D-3-phosphoglycerate dehydrogenase